MMILGIYVIVGSPFPDIQALLQDALTAANIPPSYVQALAYGLVAIGAVSLIAGFAGCCGAVKESQCLLGTYLFILSIVLAGEIAVAAVAYFKTGEFEKLFKTALTDSIPVGGFNTASGSKRAGTMMIIQSKLQCCGLIHGCADWSGGATEGCGCAVPKGNNCTDVPVTSNGQTCTAESGVTAIYTTDCYTAAVNYVLNNKMIIGAFVIAVVAVEVLGICFASILCCNIRKLEYESA
jgi:hypothetical protein